MSRTPVPFDPAEHTDFFFWVIPESPRPLSAIFAALVSLAALSFALWGWRVRRGRSRRVIR